MILIQAFYPFAAIAAVSFVFCLLLRGLNPHAYLPLITFVVTLILLVAVGMSLVPYIVLRRGSLVQYIVTLASIPPLMVYVSVSNAPSILKTLFGRREQFKRTPKSRPAATRPTIGK